MWRMLLSIGVMFGGVAWSALAIIVIFLIAPSLWEALFGPRFAAFGAMAALGGAVWSSAKLMSLGDRLAGMRDGRRSKDGSAETTVDAAESDIPTSWPEYNAAIARNKRWAFYRRTGQFDRLAALEAELRAERK